MGLYDKYKGKDFTYLEPAIKIDPMQLKIPLAMLAGLVILLVLFMFIASQVQFNPISAEFEEQPMRIDFQKSIIVTVNVLNVFPENARNVQVRVVPESTALIVFPAQVKTIPFIETATHKSMQFNLTTLNYAKGSHEFKVIVSMNNQVFEKKFTLEVV